jgi:hypothetical protein
MNIETIKTYRIHMNPVGKLPMLDIGVHVDERDLPKSRAVYVANIFVERVIHTLTALFGMNEAEVDTIREKLEAGVPVDIEVQALPTQLVQAGFIAAH